MNGEGAKKERVDPIINTLSNLRGAGFANEEESSGLGALGLGQKAATLAVLIKTQSEEILLSVGNLTADENNYYTLRTGDDTVYLLSKHIVNNMHDNLEKLSHEDGTAKK